MKFYLCANRHHFRSKNPLCPYPGCTAEVRPTAMSPSTDGGVPSFKHLPRLPGQPLDAPLPASSPPPGAKGTCTVCGREFTVTRSGLPRHKGVTEFDLATDGVCSGSNGAAGPVVEHVAAPSGVVSKHSIRWWAYIDSGRSRRTSSMKDNEFRWDATCSCGWDSATGGAPMGDVDKMAQEHKRG